MTLKYVNLKQREDNTQKHIPLNRPSQEVVKGQLFNIDYYIINFLRNVLSMQLQMYMNGLPMRFN